MKQWHWPLPRIYRCSLASLLTCNSNKNDYFQLFNSEWMNVLQFDQNIAKKREREKQVDFILVWDCKFGEFQTQMLFSLNLFVSILFHFKYIYKWTRPNFQFLHNSYKSLKIMNWSTLFSLSISYSYSFLLTRRFFFLNSCSTLMNFVFHSKI